MELVRDRLGDFGRGVDPHLRPDQDVDVGSQAMAQPSRPHLRDFGHAVHPGDGANAIDQLGVDAIKHSDQDHPG